jgi:lambda family phage tail tape measure protein
MLEIEQNYQDKLVDLRKSHEAKDISDSVYDRETAALEEALKTRQKMQEKYYQDLDKLQQNGTAGFISGFATQAESATNLYANMQSVGAETFANLTDAVTEWAETGKLDAQGFAASFIQSVGHALLAYAAGQVAMAGLSAFSAMVGVPFVGPVIAPAAAIAATAAAGVLMSAVGASLDGQAHDGIDFVPADGTWNLKKGERVTTAETSAKLDATLARIQMGQTASPPQRGRASGGPITQINNYPTQPDNRTANQAAAALARKQRQASRLT